MSCPNCAKEWNEVFVSKGRKCKVQILQVPKLGNGIFRVAACDEHLEELKKIIAKGLKSDAKPKPKSRKPREPKIPKKEEEVDDDQ